VHERKKKSASSSFLLTYRSTRFKKKIVRVDPIVKMLTPPINGKNDFSSSAAGVRGGVEAVSGASDTALAFSPAEPGVSEDSPVGFVDSSLESFPLDGECCDAYTIHVHWYFVAPFGLDAVAATSQTPAGALVIV
jgi:hypothetical protein